MTEKERLSTEPYKGVRDFYPDELAKREAVFATVRKTLRLHGYEAYDASPLEPSELYVEKGNEEIVREQTFTFEDRGGRSVTLRPEMTPTLARMVAAKRRELVFPLRWFSIGNRFRYERPQRGRLREFYQTDVDLIGLPEGEADYEVVLLADRVMKAFGATEKDYVIRVNSRKLLRDASAAAGHDAQASRAYLRLLDRREKMPEEDYETELAKLGVKDPLTVIEEAGGDAIAAERDRITGVVEELRARGAENAVCDPTLTRGFDYYTGIVFEVFDTNPENPRSLFGGGRYDELVTLFGGDPIPAIGFAFGDVGFMNFLETHGLLPEASSAPGAYIGTPGVSDILGAQAFAKTLRAGGIRAVVNIADKGLGDQIKEAVKRGVPYFIAYGTDEAKKGNVRIKELSTGKEKELSAKKVAAYLDEKLKAISCISCAR